MGSQGFRNIAGNPFVYQEDTRSAAFGLDAAAQKWKLSVKATAGALPTDTAQLMIDPATNGDVTVDPNGSGNFVVTSGNVSITAGNLVLPSVGAYLYWNVDAAQRGQVFINKMVTAASFPAHRFLHSTGISTGGYDTCTYLGHGAGETVGNTTQGNTVVGYLSAPSLSNSGGGFNGGYNTSIGTGAMAVATSAQFNFFGGGGAAHALTTGIQNCIIGGGYAAYRLVTGSRNLILGVSNQIISADVRYWGAGYNLTGSESNNVLIQASGTTGVSNRLQIGDATGTGVGELDSAYICGIYGKTVGATNGVVVIDNANKLGSLSALTSALGGTGLSTYAQGDILYASATTTLSALAKDTNATRYLSNTGTSNNPAWAQIDLSNGVTGTLPAANGGRMTWSTLTSDATAAVNNGYLIKHATPATKLVVTLPATAALYSEIEIDGYTAGLWKLAQNSGQTIHFNSIDTTTGTGGYLEATNRYDSVLLRCVVTDTEWMVVRSQGTITIV